MSIRLRKVNGVTVALCAARTEERAGDVYLGEAEHHALYEKFARDFAEEGMGLPPPCEEQRRLAEAEESSDGP